MFDLIYLYENARHVNLVALMHSISHSPTDRTVNESRTIDLYNLVKSNARKKHSKKNKKIGIKNQIFLLEYNLFYFQFALNFIGTYAHYFRDRVKNLVDCTLVDRLTLNKCRNLDSVRHPCRNPNGSLVDHRVGNFL